MCVFLSRSAQRVSIFQDNVEKEVSGSTSSRQELKPIRATRWAERHDSIIICVTLLPAVFSTLEEVPQENKLVEGFDQSSNFAQFCTEMHVFNRGFSYATHFWYNPACFKTATKKNWIYLQWLSSLMVCWMFCDKTEAIAKTFFIKYLTKLRMNVKNMMLHYWFGEDAKAKFSDIIILLMTLDIFSGSHICTVFRSFNSGNGG